MRFRHPSHHELFAHAEALVDRNRSVRVEVARHASRCRRCRHEIAQIQRTLSLCKRAPELEPSEALTNAILLAAREQSKANPWRQTLKHIASRQGWRLVESLALTACLLLMLVGSCRIFLSPGMVSPGEMTRMETKNMNVTARSDIDESELRRAATHIAALSGTLQDPSGTLQDPSEWRTRRSAQVFNGDLSAAVAALKRNPGYERASRTMDRSLERFAHALKEHYVDRPL